MGPPRRPCEAKRRYLTMKKKKGCWLTELAYNKLR